MLTRKRILLFYLNYSTFVKEDDGILSRHFIVKKFHFKVSKNPFFFLAEMIKLKLFCLINILRADIVYIWFADYHSFIPALLGKLFRKKVVLVIGGFDAVFIPSINFGVFRKNNFRAFCARKSIQWADLILPVDESLIDSVNKYADPSGKGYHVGIKHFVPNIKGRIEVVPTGYDTNKWHIMNDVKRDSSVVTIGGAPDMQTFRRKGLDLFIETAALMPNKSFFIIGLKGEMEVLAKKLSTPNVVSLGYIDNDELPAILNKHKVFVQFSLSEGLPNTLCEAMLCGCIPVGSAVNGIPKGIGNTGLLLHEKNAILASQCIREALSAPDKMGLAARNHIEKNFPLKKRAQRLVELLREL